MKHLGMFLVGLALTGCVVGHAGPPQVAPAVGSAAHAEALVRQQLAGDQVDSVQVEAKDAAWVASNLGLNLAPGTSTWVAVAHGRLHGTVDSRPQADGPQTFLTGNFVLDAATGEVLRTSLGDRQPLAVASPTVTAAEAEQRVRTAMASSQIDSAKVELLTFQWVSDNLGHGDNFYTADSPAWVVTLTGKLKRPEADTVPVANGKVVVAPDTGLIMGVDLYPGDFIPTAAPSLPPRPTSGDYLTVREPSPHP